MFAHEPHGHSPDLLAEWGMPSPTCFWVWKRIFVEFNLLGVEDSPNLRGHVLENASEVTCEEPETGGHMRYTATITSASLRLRESRVVADLLLRGVNGVEWRQSVIEGNVLQMNSVESIRRIASLLRARLEPLGEGLWEMVRDGERELASQACCAGAVKHSRLLGDFMDITLREQRALFAKRLEPRLWLEYIAGCRGRDPDMPHWSDSTVVRLRSSIFSMLAEAGYLKDTRSLLLLNVFVDTRLAAYLRDRGETYVLRCMEVTG